MFPNFKQLESLKDGKKKLIINFVQINIYLYQAMGSGGKRIPLQKFIPVAFISSPGGSMVYVPTEYVIYNKNRLTTSLKSLKCQFRAFEMGDHKNIIRNHFINST